MNVYHADEFDAVIGDDGTIQLPESLLNGYAPGTAVTIRITKGSRNPVLFQRGVTEGEIGQIAQQQMEPRENIVRFLLVEGSLAGNRGFRSRLSAFLKSDR